MAELSFQITIAVFWAMVDRDGVVQSEVFFHEADARAEAADWPGCRLVKFVDANEAGGAEESPRVENRRLKKQIEADLRFLQRRIDEVGSLKRRITFLRAALRGP